MKPGNVRIIAGKWRSRRLLIPSIKGLRPTPDRVRETLFNWLSPVIAGSHCLDMYAGSGVLGFEALSRGASHVVMVDNSADVVKLLTHEFAALDEKQEANALIYQARMPLGLQPVKKPFDIVFIDPPYQEDLLLPSCAYLEEQHYLANSAYIYLEARQRIEDNALPDTWRIIKQQQAGQVFYHLAKREI